MLFRLISLSSKKVMCLMSYCYPVCAGYFAAGLKSLIFTYMEDFYLHLLTMNLFLTQEVFLLVHKQVLTMNRHLCYTRGLLEVVGKRSYKILLKTLFCEEVFYTLADCY